MFSGNPLPPPTPQPPISPPAYQRDDLQHRLNFELMKAIGAHWQVALAGSFTFNGTNVPLYEYDREIVGGYLTYRF